MEYPNTPRESISTAAKAAHGLVPWKAMVLNSDRKSAPLG